MKLPRSGSIERNAVWSGITNFSDVFTFVLAILAGRLLGATDFGTFSFALALATVFATSAALGLNSLAIRDVARERHLAARYLGNILSWKCVLSTLAYCALLLTAALWLWNNDEARLAVAVLGLSVMVRFFSMTGRAFYQALERFDIEAIVVGVEQGLLLVVGAAALLLGSGLAGLCWTYVIVRGIGLLINLVVLKRTVGLRMRFETSFIKDLQLQALPIGIAMVVMSAYLHVDTLIMSRLLTFTEVGLYNAAFKIYVGLFIIPSVITAVLFPRLSRSFLHDKAGHNRLLIYGVGALFGAAALVAVVGIPLAEFGITLVFGAEYAPAAGTMKILLGVLVLTFQIWFLRIFLIAIDRQRALMVFSLFGLACRAAFDLWLIPRHGIAGAALATGAAEGVLLVAIWIFLLIKHFRVRTPDDLRRKIASGLFRAPTDPID